MRVADMCLDAALVAALLTASGCSRGGQPRQVGGDLPVVSRGSVALPGATDAADAPHAPSVAESEAATLTAYQDPATGVSFRYPTVWRPPQTQALPSPNFAAVAGPPRITQAFTPEGNVYAPTVLRALTFSYTAVPNRKAPDCAALPAKATPGGGPAHTVTYGGVPYTEVRGGDAGACTQVQSQVDSTVQGGQCLVFERDFITTCPYTKSATLPRPLSNAESAALQRHLDAVMASVQITPR